MAIKIQNITYSEHPVGMKHLAAYILIVVWLISTVFAFWWFMYRDIRAFDENPSQERDVRFNAEHLQDLLKQEISTTQTNEFILINFIAPGCSCNRFNISHVNALEERFRGQVRVEHLTPQGSEKAFKLKKLNKAATVTRARLISEQEIPGSPAAAILNKQGELLYFGPYSDGAMCGQGNNIVERALTKLSNGESLESGLNTRAFGCYCDWR
ncbi:MAG: DUF6436 domain-containing protein [Gammaproteobacteria bacterium]|nr:DUF6436 domain-containing protein [Gammaproteobacteria bacterium]